MDKIKRIISIKTGIIALIVVLIIVLLIAITNFINYKMNFMDRLINEKRADWDLTIFQNSLTSGSYMGILYEKDYDINDIPSNVASVLAANYYISHDDDFYMEKNYVEDEYYEKTISKKEMDKTLKAMFGTGYTKDLINMEHSCGFLKVVGNNYIIRAKDPEACGVFGPEDKYYVSNITNYYKEDDNIIIETKVGYIETNTTTYEDEDTEAEETTFAAYKDKTKKVLINENYSTDCIFDERVSPECYTAFKTYQIVLTKSNDNKYHFNKITNID